METLSKINIEFNIFKTLQVIENDGDLNKIFRGNLIKVSYSTLNSLALHGKMNPEMISRAKEIFERIILTTGAHRRAYLKLCKAVDIAVLPQIDAKPVKLPKHYGKKRILEDIKNNKSVTELDKAMLALNSLRNIYATLKARCIKEKLTDAKAMTNNDFREIIATVRIVENKIKPLLKK